MAAGVLALLDAATTIVWQEPLTALYTTIQQDNLGGSLRALDRAAPTSAVGQRIALLRRVDERVAVLARDLESRAPDGGAVGRIEIPRIGVSFVVVNGTSTADLEEGPGIYSRAAFPQRTFPGLSGTTAIAGHRTTYLAPFRHIDTLRNGAQILLTMPYGRFTYTVTGRRVVNPNEVGAAVDPTGFQRLVLSACTPLFSAAQRILVFARLTNTVPLGAARAYVRRLVASTNAPNAFARRIGLPAGGLREGL
jgi:sortase A